jgi:hypothetical protein
MYSYAITASGTTSHSTIDESFQQLIALHTTRSNQTSQYHPKITIE